MNVIVTAGGTSEPIDSVRKITNSSSGKLSFVIASELLRDERLQIDNLFYICSKHAVKPKRDSRLKVLTASTAQSVHNLVKKLLLAQKIGLFVHAMALSDYEVDYVCSTEQLAAYLTAHTQKKAMHNLICSNTNVLDANGKISSHQSGLIIKLKPTPKTIKLIKQTSPATFLVGFKLLTSAPQHELEGVATKLLQQNSCDMVVANNLCDISARKHKATIIMANGNKVHCATKQQIATSIVSHFAGMH